MENNELIIKNAHVFDAGSNINGDQKDILIKNGKIVEKVSENAKKIDASNLIALPGLIDSRSYTFSPQANLLRTLPLNIKGLSKVSSIKDNINSYINHGFTFVAEMEVPMTQTKLTLSNMSHSSILDTGMILDLGSNWTWFSDIREGGHENKIAVIISEFLSQLKGISASFSLPYHSQYWNLNKKIPDEQERIPNFNFSIEEAYKTLLKSFSLTDIKSIPFISLYNSENIQDESLNFNMVRNLAKNKNNFCISSINHYFMEHSSPVLELYNENKNIFIEINPISLESDRPLLSRDKNLCLEESKLSGTPISTVDLELDTEYYITSRKIDNPSGKNIKILVSAIEILLELKKSSSLDRAIISSNMPNNISISDFPQFIDLILNVNSRKSKIEKIITNKNINGDFSKSDISLDFMDISKVLSLNPAKLLGLDNKGHLGLGADADIVLFEIDPDEISSGSDSASDMIIKSLSKTKYTIKNGEVIVSLSNINKENEIKGNTYFMNSKRPTENREKTIELKRHFFQMHYSMFLDSLFNIKTDRMLNVLDL